MSDDFIPSLLDKHLLLVRAACDCDMARSHIGVLAVIIAHVFDGKASSYPGPATIMKQANLNRRTVRRCIDDLSAWGYCRVERPGNREKNVYWPAFHQVSAASARGQSTPRGQLTHKGKDDDLLGSIDPHPRGLRVPSLGVNRPTEAVSLNSSSKQKKKTIGSSSSLGEEDQQRSQAIAEEGRKLAHWMEERERLEQQQEQEQLAEIERRAKSREDTRTEYMLALQTQPGHARMMEGLFLNDILDLIPNDVRRSTP